MDPGHDDLAGSRRGRIGALLAAATGPLPSVPAQAETEPVTNRLFDCANDPAIWRYAEHPSASLIVSTDKKAGLAIHDLTGKLLNFCRLGPLNNVDIFPEATVAGEPAVVVAASDRSDKNHPVLCLYRRGNSRGAFIIYEEEVVEQIEPDFSGPEVTGRSVRQCGWSRCGTSLPRSASRIDPVSPAQTISRSEVRTVSSWY